MEHGRCGQDTQWDRPPGLDIQAVGETAHIRSLWLLCSTVQKAAVLADEWNNSSLYLWFWQLRSHSALSATCAALHHTVSYRWVTDAHLITDEFPLLLVVILPQQSRFVWREIHRVLKERKRSELIGCGIETPSVSWVQEKNGHPRLTKKQWSSYTGGKGM